MSLKRLHQLSSVARRHPYAAVAITTLVIGAIPSITWAIWPESEPRRAAVKRDPRYATQSGNPAEARRTHVLNRRAEDVDSAVETCGELGVRGLADRYEVPAIAERVARVFAEHHEPAFRAGAYEGCLQGLRAGGG